MNRNTDVNDIPFARPSIGDDEIEAVTRVLRSGWLTTGKEALAFEREFAAYIDAPFALAVSSATAGLHLALEATGTGHGDVVIVPSFTFTATAEVARYLGAEVCFADITADGFMIDPRHVEMLAREISASGKRLSAIIVVHYAGEVGPVGELREIADRYGAALIEDAAHAFPSKTDAGFAGTIGDVGVFSFYANKTITTGEGGMVVTNNPIVAERIKTMRLHGIDREAWDRYSNPRGSWQYQVVEAGYKYNMPDIAAAIGRVQLRRADELLNARRQAAFRYHEGFRSLHEAGTVTVPTDRPGHAWHLYVLRLRNSRPSRDDVVRALQEGGIGTSVHYTPLHRMNYWAQRYPDQRNSLPHTDRRFEEILSLPLYPDITASQQHRVIQALQSALAPSSEEVCP